MRDARGRRGRVAARVVLSALTAAYLAEAVELRRRATRLDGLRAPGRAPGTGPASSDAATDAERDGGVGVLALPRTEVDAATRAAAAAEMDATGIQAIDLVPADLDAERALRLLRRVDPGRLRSDPLHAPGGAHEALVLSEQLAGRVQLAGVAPGDRAALARLTVRAQRHAPAATALRVASRLRSTPLTGADRWRELEELTAFARPLYALAPLLVGVRAAHLGALTVGTLVAPLAGLVALVAWSAQPVLVFAGPRPGRTGLAPPGLTRSSVARLPLAWRDVAAAARAGRRDARAGAGFRSERVALTAPPADERFEPRRESCPWCGSPTLRGRLDTVDLFQHKPGRFHLDECTDCGHIFQNPRLTPAGLDYYYAQFYDGVSEEMTETSFAAMARIYHRRADAIARVAEPRACLDVGTGHAHFCLVARNRWPDAVVDGLDLGESVEEARRRGWIGTAYRGRFVDLAGGLPRPYDLVTMHHYLEHTREPRDELVAAAKVLEPGGHLVVEVPDPASPWSRRLGRYWYSWFQPQHQHFVRCENLVAALDDEGFDVLSVERGAANLGGDLFTGVVLAMQHLAPPTLAPWHPPATPAARAWRCVAVAVALPAMVLAVAPDLIMDAHLRRPGTAAPGNALRVVARRR